MKKNKKADIRFLNEMKSVIRDQEWFKKIKNPEKFPIYEMYRGLKIKNGWRYDITVIPPKMLGEEFVKTKGNRNSNGYLEIYTVLKGEAIFLLQKMTNGKVKDVIAIKAKKGDFVLDPAGYYIISINPSEKILELGNWVPEKNKNIYKEMEEKQGACYHYTKNGWLENEKYKKTPKMEIKKPLKSMPQDLKFLKSNN
ncbi:MAG: glucose-6-phosphate isomerase family protein [bacterium]|nr:glucose-6-phosphate isomerase family protein [bacterium]